MTKSELWDRVNRAAAAPVREPRRADARPFRYPRALPCLYEGAVQEWCHTCPATAEGKHVRACDLHDSCTRETVSDRVRSCAMCDDYRTFPPVTRRHLLFHIYPVSGNGAWQWNVDEMCRRIHLFDGAKVVAVAVDPPTGRKPDPSGPHSPDGWRDIRGCDTLGDVKERFGPHAAGIEFIECENDPSLREVATYPLLFERVERFREPGDVTLYAQAKGTTRPPGHVAHQWARTLYEVFLDHWPVVEMSLGRHPITGAFKKYGPGWVRSQSASDWHYSGSWFAVRNAEFFQKNWRTIDRFWSGIEPLPSQHFGAEAGCVFLEDRVSRMNLYHTGYWDRVVFPALNRFRTEHANRRSPGAP